MVLVRAAGVLAVAGAIVLSIWSGVNLLLASAILISMTMFGRNAPGLRILFDEAAVRGLDPRGVATVNAIAVLFNASGGVVLGTDTGEFTGSVFGVAPGQGGQDERQ